MTQRKAKLDAPPPLPVAGAHGRIDHDGAKIWYAAYGSGPVVILLHGGLGNSGDWGNQVPALVASGRRVLVIDSRGQGRSTRDARPFTYELMASDVLAVMDALHVATAALVGWSDGAIISLILAMTRPDRVMRVFAFGGNMDLGGVKAIAPGDPLIAQVIDRAARDYARLSDTPRNFAALSAAVARMMATQPNYTAHDLARIAVPVTIADGEFDEFITREHIAYLARSIPGAHALILPGVSHFAPLQDPAQFNAALLAFLEAEPAR